MMLEEHRLLINETQSIIDNINKEENIKGWAPLLYKLIAHLDANNVTKRILKKTLKEYIKRRDPYNKETKKVAESITRVSNEVLQYLEQTPNAKMMIPDEPWLLRDASIADYAHVMARLSTLLHIFMLLHKSTDKSVQYFIKKFVEFNESGQIIKKHFVEIKELADEAHYVQRVEYVNIGYSILKIMQFAKLYDPMVYNNARNMLMKANNKLGVFILDVRYKGLYDALDRTQDSKLHGTSFDIEHFKHHAQQVHHYIQSQLFTLGKKKNKETPTKLTMKKGATSLIFIDDRKRKLLFELGSNRARKVLR